MDASENLFPDPVRVRDLVAFANERRESSQAGCIRRPHLRPMPRSTNGTIFLEPSGWAGTFSPVSCEKWKGTRSASADEISRFQVNPPSRGDRLAKAEELNYRSPRIRSAVVSRLRMTFADFPETRISAGRGRVL